MRRGGQAAATVAFGILLALALLLSYIEVLLPLSIGIPGVKLGLANLASLICLYLFGLRRAALISLLRIILTGFLFGNMAAILYSLSGATLSLTAAVLAKRSQLFGEIGVSVIGAIFHNLGQRYCGICRQVYRQQETRKCEMYVLCFTNSMRDRTRNGGKSWLRPK